MDQEVIGVVQGRLGGLMARLPAPNQFPRRFFWTTRLAKRKVKSLMMRLVLAIALVSLGTALEDQAASTIVIGWGDNSYGQLNVPPGLTNVFRIAVGERHSLALASDGTVIAWGGTHTRASLTFRNERPRADGTQVPKGLTNVVAVAAGSDFSLALKANGTVVAWGNNSYGQTDIPAGLTNIAAISTGLWHCLVLRSNGTVVAWGFRDEGDEISRSIVPIEITNAMGIAAGAAHNLVLKTDGTVVGWGQREWRAGVVPANLSNVVAIAAGSSLSLALNRDGTVAGWGFNRSGAATGSPSVDKYPWTDSGLVRIGGEIVRGVAAVSAGDEYSLALRPDGTVIGWGHVPSHGPVSNIVAIAAGKHHCLLLQYDGSR